MEWTNGDGDDGRPSSRDWRHPSEVDRGPDHPGDLEPPIAIGRGLATATGTISLVLSLVLLMALLPTNAGTTSIAGSVTTSVAADGLTTGASPVSTAVTTAPAAPATVTAEGGGSFPVPTYLVTPPDAATTGTVRPASSADVAVAIAIDDGALIITTSAAVQPHREVTLDDGSGRLLRARVVLVDDSTGLAVLVPEIATGLAGIDVATVVEPGDRLLVPGHLSMTTRAATLAPDIGGQGSGTTTVPGAPATTDALTVSTLSVDDLHDAVGVLLAADPALGEGHPVLNQRGELVAICTRRGLTPLVMLFDRVVEIRRLLGAMLRPTVWLGISVDDLLDGSLRIGAVDPDGPARRAGLVVGDEIAAVDGVTVGSALELAGVLAVHRVGDRVTLTVRSAAGTTAAVTVVLVAPPREL